MLLQKPAADAAAKCGRVAVLMGGDSAEREVSLNSGNAVYQALLEAGVDAIPVDLQACDFHQLAELKVDRVFNVLHGGGVKTARFEQFSIFSVSRAPVAGYVQRP
jgi:D-alanine-D-alanine ligase-like ATP-grasp enzyme